MTLANAAASMSPVGLGAVDGEQLDRLWPVVGAISTLPR